MVTCSATAKSTGQRCRRAPLKGSSVCLVHGASAGQVRAAAARRVTEAKVLAVYEKFVPNGHGPVDVVAELERLVAKVVGFSDFATARIEALTSQQWAEFDPRTQAEIALFQQVLRDAGRLLTEVARLGLDARWVQARRDAAEAKVWADNKVADLVADVVERGLYRLELTERQWELARSVFPEEFMRLKGPADD